LTTTRGGKGERISCRWWLQHVGDKTSLMKLSCLLGSDCEAGYLKPGGRNVSAEGYIRSTREMVKEARMFPAQCLRTNVSLPEKLTFAADVDLLAKNPEAKLIFALMGGKEEKYYGDTEVRMEVPIDEELPALIEKLRGLLGKDLHIRGHLHSYKYQNDW
ncbi:MAG: hypothetical protein AB1664_20215, partial [Thermodesulfobacteriota bacterium]